jgi:hypothetical protein
MDVTNSQGDELVYFHACVNNIFCVGDVRKRSWSLDMGVKGKFLMVADG